MRLSFNKKPKAAKDGKDRRGSNSIFLGAVARSQDKDSNWIDALGEQPGEASMSAAGGMPGGMSGGMSAAGSGSAGVLV